jgi:AraC-like DNA-binding protein
LATTTGTGYVMVSCVKLSSEDPAELATIIRPTNGDVVVTERGTFRSKAIRLNMARLWMQQVEETLPRIWQGGASRTRAAIVFLSHPGPGMAFQGAEAGEGLIGICPIGQPLWQRLTGPSCWGSMSLSVEHWAGLSTVAGADLFASTGMIVTPRSSDMLRLQRLHRSTARLAHDAPELLEHQEVARGIEESLILAMVECLQPRNLAGGDIPLLRRSKIMRRLRELLDELGDAPLYVPELCTKLNVASRTLRAVCHEYLGMGPKKYLHLRRMHLVRRALRAGDAGTTTVTDIATRFGFWELGRFAVEYKSLFGEMPSGTLRQNL